MTVYLKRRVTEHGPASEQLLNAPHLRVHWV